MNTPAARLEQDPRRRVLLVTTRYPPDQGGVSALRPLKFARYLPRFGWDALVLAPHGVDPGSTAMALHPGNEEVVRTPVRPTPGMLLDRLRRARNAAPPGPRGGAPGGRLSPGSPVGGMARRILNAFEIPDFMAGWIPSAVREGVRLVRHREIEAVVAHGPPFSAVVAGARIAEGAGVPLVVDFRDCWTLDPEDPHETVRGRYRQPTPPGRLRRLRSLEAQCIRDSSAILFTAETARALYADRYPDASGQMRVILNGADPADFVPDGDPDPGQQAIPSARPGLVHVGNIHGFQETQLRRLVQAFGHLRRASGNAPDLLLVGPVPAHIEGGIRSLARELGVADHISWLGLVPHAEAVQVMRGAGVLLLFDGGNPLIRPAKLSELWFARRPVLAFCAPGGAAEQEVLSEGGVVVTDGAPVEAVAAAVREAVSASPPEGPPPERYSRLEGARQLAEILEKIT